MSGPRVPAEAPGPRSFSGATVVYIALTVCVAILLLVLGWMVTGNLGRIPAILVLTALGVLGHSLSEPVANDEEEKINLSVISIVVLAAAVICGPVGGGIVGACAALLQVKPSPGPVRVFNGAMISSMGSLSGLTYLVAGGTSLAERSFEQGAGLSPQVLLAQVGAPLMLADVMQCVVNAVLLAGVISLSGGPGVSAQAWRLLRTMGPSYIGYGIIAFLLVVLWVPAGVGPFAAALVLVPLFVARWAFVQFADERKVRDRTVRALVTALETKEPMTAGHSARVQRLSGWMAEAMWLGHREALDVSFAALLHDVGMIAVPSSVLRAPAGPGDAWPDLLDRHALSGVQMLRGITFMKGALSAIAHHHERWDGRGRPDGLAGADIPVGARIIAVADAFDSLTTSNRHRPALGVGEALAEIRRRSGSQFDPQAVDALVRVIPRHGWSLTHRDDEAIARTSAALDHDDPEVSDGLARRVVQREVTP